MTIPCLAANDSVGEQELKALEELIASKPIGSLVLQLETPLEVVRKVRQLYTFMPRVISSLSLTLSFSFSLSFSLSS